MTRIAPVPCHVYQESLAFTVVEGWFYPQSTPARALTLSRAVFGYKAEKGIKEERGYGVGPQLGLPQEESRARSGTQPLCALRKHLTLNKVQNYTNAE